jgi:hypothetical protein
LEIQTSLKPTIFIPFLLHLNCLANTGSRPKFFFLFITVRQNIKTWRYEPPGNWYCVTGPSSLLGSFLISALRSFKTSRNTHPNDTVSHSTRPVSSATSLKKNLKSATLHYCCHFHTLSWCYYERLLQVASAVYKRIFPNNTILSQIQLPHGVHSPLITFVSPEVTTLLLLYMQWKLQKLLPTSIGQWTHSMPTESLHIAYKYFNRRLKIKCYSQRTNVIYSFIYFLTLHMVTICLINFIVLWPRINCTLSLSSHVWQWGSIFLEPIYNNFWLLRTLRK